MLPLSNKAAVAPPVVDPLILQPMRSFTLTSCMDHFDMEPLHSYYP